MSFNVSFSHLWYAQKMPPNGSGLLPGDKYPDWLAFNDNGSSVTFKVPQVDERSLKTITCIVYSSSPDVITSEGLKVLLVINCTKNTIQLYKRDALLASFDEEEWQRVVSNTEPGDIVKVTVVFENKFIVKKTTVYLVYDEPNDKKAKHCLESDDKDIGSSGDGNVSKNGLNLCSPYAKNLVMQKELRKIYESNWIMILLLIPSFLFEFRYLVDSSSDFLHLFEPF